MVRHPHFTQPIFVRFPRPAVLQGRDGAERFPQATDVTIENALYRSLRALDPAISFEWIKQQSLLYDEDELIAARNATLLARPANIRAFFESRLRKPLTSETASRPVQRPVKALSSSDPYEV
jgi:hypothetical protein